jgi:flavin prenyltransferase
VEPVDHGAWAVNAPFLGGGTPRRVIVGVSGATGTALAVRALQMLGAAGVERHLVVSPSARRTAAYEMPDVKFERDAEVVHQWRDIGASIASGSYPVDAMLVIPCSVKTLSAIAAGVSENLLVRAADVTLKERRPLMLVVREAPLRPVILEHLLSLSREGASVIPASPAFYAGGQDVQQLIDFLVGKILDLCHVDHDLYRRWTGQLGAARRLTACGEDGLPPHE